MNAPALATPRMRAMRLPRESGGGVGMGEGTLTPPR
jgi:hypothetical protein